MKNKIFQTLSKNQTIAQILKTIFREKAEGKPGLTISELSEKTGVERHRLSGILEVLVVMGLLVVFEIGMMKVVAPTPVLTKMKSLIGGSL